MAATRVQNVTSGTTAATTTIGAGQGWVAPAAGHVLIAWYDGDNTCATPTGFTAGPSVVANNGVYFFWKVAAGTETSIAFAQPASTTAVMGVLEYSGLLGSPFDVQNASPATSSLGTSTPAVSVTTTSANGALVLALAGLHGQEGSAVAPTSPSWTASLTNIVALGNGTPSTSVTAVYSHAFLGELQTGAAGAVSTSCSWTTTILDRQELVIAFKLAASAASSMSYTRPRRRVGAPPRKVLGYQSRAVVPVRAQVNPPFLTVDVRGQRRYLLPVRRAQSAQVVSPQVNPPFLPVDVRGQRRYLLPARRAKSAQATPEQLVPTLDVRGLRRYLLPVRRATSAQVVRAQVNPPFLTLDVRGLRRYLSPVRRAKSAQVTPGQIVVTPSVSVPTPPRVRRLSTMLRRRQTPQVITGAAEVPWTVPTPNRPTLYRRRPAPRAPLAAQDAPPVTTTRRRAATPSRRLRATPGPWPSQAAPVAPLRVPVVARGLRLIAHTARRADVASPVSAQQAATPNPSVTQTMFGRLRLAGRTNRTPRIVKPIPPQLNPPIIARSYGRLRTTGRIQPRPHIDAPTPAQQSLTLNPKVTQTVFGRLRLVGRANRTPRIVKPIPAQVNPPYPVKPSRVVAQRGMSRRRGGPTSVPQVQPTAETRTAPTGGLRGLRRIWLKIRRKNVTPIPSQVTTLQGPLVITDSSGGVEADRNAGTTIGGVYGSTASSTVSKGSSGAFTADPDTDDVVGTYDSDSDTL